MVLSGWFNDLGTPGKVAVVVAGSIAIGATAYGFYTLYKQSREAMASTASSDESDDEGGIPEKKILVLGLEGSGKTVFLSALSQPESTSHRGKTKPTEGFNVVCITTDGLNLNIWEIGGSKRQYWPNFIGDTSLLVYVIDASNPSKFEEAKRVFYSLLSETKLIGVPVLIVSSKNDIPGAKPLEGIIQTLGLESRLGSKWLAVSVQVKENGVCLGLSEARDKILQLCK